MISMLRQRLSYANVVATVALFIGLGGTSYALTLPRNSVGAEQLRSRSVGRSEIRSGAVRTSEIRNGAIRLRDISQTARTSLRGDTGPAGPQGPAGVPFFQAINSAGQGVTGNATAAQAVGTNGTRVIFSRSVASCVATATLTSLAGGPNPVPPVTAHVTAEISGTGVLVRTWDAAGNAQPYPFNLIVAC